MLQRLHKLGYVALTILNIILFQALFSTQLLAQFSGGDGSVENPYQISTIDELQSIRTGDNLSKHYVLKNDIDATDTRTWNAGQGFLPLGDSFIPFSGSFDGKGFTIDGLYINRESTNEVGLFGRVAAIEIQNIVFTNAEVRGQNNTAILIGTTNNASATLNNITILNSQLIGNGSNSGNIGLVGGSFSGSMNELNIEASQISGGYNIGGAFGSTGALTIENVTVENIKVTSTSTSSSSWGSWGSGALIGRSSSSLSIKQVKLTTFEVIGQNYLGGIIGNFDAWSGTAMFSDIELSGSLKGGSYVGGIVGYSSRTTSVENSRGTIDIEGSSYLGGFVGGGGSTIQNSSIQATISGQNYIGGINGLSSNQINNVIAEVNLEGRSYIGGISGSATSADSVSVTGSITVSQDNASNIGGVFGVGTNITNSYSTVSIQAANATSVGGLAGNLSGNIQDSYSLSTVVGGQSVGGLVGTVNQGASIANSYYAGAMSGNLDVGGLIGANAGSLSDSYWDNEVSGQSLASGRGISGSATGLSTDQMTGSNALVNMSTLDYVNTWAPVSGTYPGLLWATPFFEISDIVAADTASIGQVVPIVVTVSNKGSSGLLDLTLVDENGLLLDESRQVSMASGSSQTFTLNWNAATLSSGAYTLVIRTNDAQQDITIVLLNRPQQVQLIAPSDLETGVAVKPTLKWNAAVLTENYRIEVDTSDTFTSPLLTASNITDTTFTITDSLAFNQVYYWRVQASNQEMSGPWSPVFSFKIRIEEPGLVRLLAPQDSVLNMSRLPEFRWTAAERADEYLFTLASDPQLNAVVIDTLLSDTLSFTLTNTLAYGTDYYWTVQPKNSSGFGEITPIQYFKTRNDPDGELGIIASGRVYLEGVSNYEGVKVILDPLSPSAVRQEVSTDAQGNWMATKVAVGIYTFRFTKENYVPVRLPDIFVDNDTYLDPIFMRKGGVSSLSGEVFGTLSGDTLYVVPDSILVPEGSTLEIEAGAELQFREGAKLLVEGNLRIQATQGDSVLFTSGADVPEAGDWLGVIIRNSGDIAIQGLSVENAQTGIHIINSSNVMLERYKYYGSPVTGRGVFVENSSNISVRDSRFTVLDAPAIQSSNSDSLDIQNNYFSGGHRSIYFQNSNTVTIVKNEFSNPNARAIEIWGRDYDTDAILSDNAINFNSYNGIAIVVRNYDRLVVESNKVQLVGGLKNYSNFTSAMVFLNVQSVNTPMISKNIFIGVPETNNANSTSAIFIQGILKNESFFSKNTMKIYNEQNSTAARFGIINLYNLNEISENIILNELEGSSGGNGQIMSNSNNVHKNIFIESAYNRPLYFTDIQTLYDNRFIYLNLNRSNFISLNNIQNMESNTFEGNLTFSVNQPSSSSVHSKNLFNLLGSGQTIISYNQSSSGSFVQNTIRFSSLSEQRPEVALHISQNSPMTILGNHIEGANYALRLDAEPNRVEYNNFKANSSVIHPESSNKPRFFGELTTTNHLGTPSDIYFNLQEEPKFVRSVTLERKSITQIRDEVERGVFSSSYVDPGFYQPQSGSSLIDAGPAQITDADGTRADIGALSFDYGNPKLPQVLLTQDETVVLRFKGVNRDSVVSYNIFEAIENGSQLLATIEPQRIDSFHVSGLTNNKSYQIFARSVYPNSLSIPSDTIEVVPGIVNILARSVPLVATTNFEDSLNITYEITNDGSKSVNLETSFYSPIIGSQEVIAEQLMNRFNYRIFNKGIDPRFRSYLNISNENFDSNNDKVLMRVSGIVSLTIDPNFPDLSSDAQNFLLFPEVNPNETEITINDVPVVAIQTGITSDNTYDFILDRKAIPDLFENDRVRFAYYSIVQGNNYSGGLNIQFFNIEPENSILSLDPGQSQTLSYKTRNVPETELISHGLTIKERDDLFDEEINAYHVRPSIYGLEPQYFASSSSDEGQDPFYLLFEELLLDDEVIQAGDEVQILANGEPVAAFGYNGSSPKLVALSEEFARQDLSFQLFDASSGQQTSARLRGNSFVTSAREVYNLSLEATLFTEQTIEILPNRYNLISSALDPEISDLGALLSPIAQMQAIMDDEGGIFIPELSVNTLGSWTGERAYHLYTAAQDTQYWQIKGKRRLASERSIDLFGNRFNNLPVPYLNPIDVESSLTEIVDRISILQDDRGGVWIPSEAINTIGSLIPGRGYQLFLTGEGDISFSFADREETLKAPSSKENVNKNKQPEYFTGVQESGLAFTVLVEPNHASASWNNVKEIGLFAEMDNQETLVGAAVVPESGSVTVTAWQSIPEYGVSGFQIGMPIKIKAITESSDEAFWLTTVNEKGEPSSYQYGVGAFAKVNIELPTLTSLEDGMLPTSFALHQNYPNPFNPTTTIQFDLPKPSIVRIEVFNIMGQKVATIANKLIEAGSHNVQWNASLSSSGMYLLRMQAGEFVQTRKIMLIK